MRSFWSLACLLGWSAEVVLAAEAAAPSTERGRSGLVAPGDRGQLVYRPYSARGDVIPDFSACGFGGGGEPLPVARNEVMVEPQPAGDDTARIQAALDRVASRPVGADGLRGAVLLRRGQYRVAGILQLAATGVVLRGESDEPDGTVVVATTRKRQPLIRVNGPGGLREEKGGSVEVAADYVPVGAK